MTKENPAPTMATEKLIEMKIPLCARQCIDPLCVLSTEVSQKYHLQMEKPHIPVPSSFSIRFCFCNHEAINRLNL